MTDMVPCEKVLQQFIIVISCKIRVEKCTRTDLSCSTREMLYYIRKMCEYIWEVLPHPTYSLDISPPDFDLLPKLKELMRGRRFPTLEELSTGGVTRAVRQMNKDNE